MKVAMSLMGNGCGTMFLTLFMPKRAVRTWLSRLLAREMADLIPSTRTGGGSLMDAIFQGN